jgi:hypothetical protein
MDLTGRAQGGMRALLDGLGAAFRDAVLIALIAGAIGILVNLVHSERIPFVAHEKYEVLVPCPEPGGQVNSAEVDDPLLLSPETFLVDARTPEQHAAWWIGQAMNVPYDYLDPTPDQVIDELARRIAASKAQRVVVYGDGDTPDTGEQLGKEIAGKGIKHVFFVRGGAPALNEATKEGGGP